MELTYAAGIGALRRNEPCFELMDDARHAEEFISRKSDEMSLAMLKYIYGEAEEPGTQRKKRRK